MRVFDNGSTDGGPAWVRRRHPDVEVVELGRNRGPGASRNAALGWPGAPRVLLLDGDCSLASGCAAALRRALASQPADVCSARVVYAGDSGRIYYDAGAAHFLGLLCMENVQAQAEGAAPVTRTPGAVSTSALLVSRAAAARAGGFDEGYFFFGEDLDFSLRLRAGGACLRHVPEAVVRHHKPLPGSAAAGPQASRRERLRCRWQGPNRWRTLLKTCRAPTLLRTLPLQLAYAMLEAGDALRRGGGWEHARGMAGLLADLPRLRRERRRVQSSRVVEDGVLFGAPPLGWRAEALALPGAGRLKDLLDRACARLWR